MSLPVDWQAPCAPRTAPTTCCNPPISSRVCVGLVFYQSFDNASVLLQPAVGLGGKLQGSEAPTFVPGVLGKAYCVTKATSGALIYPGSIVPPDRGTIEVLARVVSTTSATSTIPSGNSPYFFASTSPGWCRCDYGCDLSAKPTYGSYYMGFNGNNGCQGGGLVASAGNRMASTDHYSVPVRYADILGAAATATWHRYTLVWDVAGLPGKNSTRMQMYIDGMPIGCEECKTSVPYQTPSFAPPQTVMLGHIQTDGVAVELDELRIWSAAVVPNNTREWGLLA